MPVNFLTAAQRERYSRFNTVPDESQLGAFFHLDADARRLAMSAYGPRNQLGLALQLTTVRFLGTFLDDPTEVPTAVVDFIAEQLGLTADDLKGYGEKKGRWDHQKLIRERYGYTLFDPHQWLLLGIWAYRRSWSGNERPSVLFDLATNRLVEAKILLPGVTTLERLIAGVRERVALRQFKLLSSAPTPEQRTTLQALVNVAEGGRVSQLDRYRKSPTDISGKGVVKALDRYAAIRSLGASAWNLSSVPPGRIVALARFAKAARAQAVAQLADGLAANPSVRIEDREGRDHLVLSGLDALDEPASLSALRADVAARVPVVDFPEVLLEVHSWTGCLDRFTHVGGQTPSRKEDMITSIAAVL